MTSTRSSRRLGLLLLLLAVLLAVPACSGDGHFTFLGYTTAPNYDMSIRTVYVPIFKNTTYLVNKGVEFQLTEAIVHEIESKTPFKVTNCRANADTELTGTFVNRNKNPNVYNNLGEIRDTDTTITVEVYWRDLRTGHNGKLLSLNKPGRVDDPVIPLKPGEVEPPVIVQSIAQFTPELGTSFTTALKQNIDRVAVQIVSMMEKSW